MKNNPIEITNYIREEFTNYINSTYDVDDESYSKLISNQINSLALYKGPYVHTVLPFIKGKSIRQLIDEGVLDEDFLKLGNIDVDRKLYLHQETALRRANQGNNLVITTGTGSGKTESFMYPIINSILKTIHNGTKPIGVKAILLYPMNALVNDQKDRLRALLRNYPDITFGSFTGETKESLSDEEKIILQQQEDVIYPPNELLSREQMRESPPDILFTNYSMLEYLLIRPADYKIISPATMLGWKFLILDEAHSYKGTLGIEVSMLLKRLVGTVKKNPQFILTSATLGTKKDVNDIIKFAKNLTSADYSIDDVIFASREELDDSKVLYTISPSDYVLIKKSFDDFSELNTIVNKYIQLNHFNNLEEILYDLLIHDKNVYLLFQFISGTENFAIIRKKINQVIKISDTELTALIQLISLANKDGQYIYDAKFHMFVSSPHKAFITLGKEKNFKFGLHNFINGKKAFEIGSCKNCNAIYIIGNIDKENGYLCSDDSVDIYENYDKDYNARLDFFLLNKTDDEEDLQEYVVCSKCGKIWDKENLNAETCKCDKSNYVSVYHIDNSKSSKKNNLSKCSCCGTINNISGVVQRFQLNKDDATTVLTQIYYEGMGEMYHKIVPTNSRPIDLFSTTIEEKIGDQHEVKQMLSFSDSRQQASYYAVAFDSKHSLLLRRRLVWEMIKDEERIDVKSLVSRLTTYIRDKKIFDIQYSRAQQQAWLAVLSDILLLGGAHSMEGNALAYYQFQLTDENLSLLKMSEKQIYELFKLTVEEFIELIQLTIVRFRNERAVNYEETDITEDEFKDVFQYGAHTKFFVEKKSIADKSFEGKFISSFLPVRDNENQRNVTIDYLMKITGESYEKCLEMSKNLFKLMSNLKFFEDKIIDNIKCLRIPVNRFDVIPYHKTNWYICDKCRKITPHNIKNICPEIRCNGHLTKCNPDEIRKNDYYRNEYKKMPIEKIVVREHTAQLSKEKGREYQKEFKQKKVNILSSSTTFEMGVDIGSLENVFLRNMPPTPANYVQRAGRAGRSKSSSALVVTYCGNNSHDFSYFTNPQPMIEGVVKAPQFDLNNEKIVLRHILASAFAYFFRENPLMFKKAENLIYENNMDEFLEYIKAKPKELGDFVDSIILDKLSLDYLKNFAWINYVIQDNSKLILFIKEMTGKLKRIEDAEKEASDNQEYDLANYFKSMLVKLKKKSVIQVLSENTIIPKYGFPVDVVNLDIIGEHSKSKNYNLQRDLSIAISEYAPGSEVIVDKQKYVSRFINLPVKGELERYYFKECPNCEYIKISEKPFEDNVNCPICDNIMSSNSKYFMVPELGFSTDRKQKVSRTSRPLKTYNARIKYLGGGEKEDISFEYKQISMETIRNDELLVMNESGFYYCAQCGYTKIDKNKFSQHYTYKHKTKYGYQCEHKELTRIALGHKFKTDVVKLHFLISVDYEKMVSLLYALLEGMSKALQIERNDVNGLVRRTNNYECEMILYDNVPGGAGHVKRIMNKEVMNSVLNEAYNIVNQNCCDEDTSCYKCLRNYYNQAYHSIIKRKYAKEIIKQLLGLEE